MSVLSIEIRARSRSLFFFSNIQLSAIFQSILQLKASNFSQSFLIHCTIPQFGRFWVLDIQFSGIQQKLVISPILVRFKKNNFANKELFLDYLYIRKVKYALKQLLDTSRTTKNQKFRNLEDLTIFLILPKKEHFLLFGA